MKTTLSTGNVLQISTDLLVVPVTGKVERNEHAARIDKAMGGHLLPELRRQRFGSAAICVFGDQAEAEGTAQATAQGADFYLRRPQSPILFVAKARYWVARSAALTQTPAGRQ